MSMTYEEYLKQHFAQLVLVPLRWVNSAWRLMEAAEYLTNDIQVFWRSLDKNDEEAIPLSVHVGVEYQPIFMMLYGFAIENLCKAYIVTQLTEKDREQLTKGQLPRRLITHDLLHLVQNEIRLDLDIDERELLKRLRAAVEWDGRYPVSTGPGDMQRLRERRTMPEGIMGDDVPRTRRLAERIQSHVIAMLDMKVSVHSPHRRSAPVIDAGRWTTDTPTAPGWYWNRGAGGRTRIFELRDEGHGLFIVQTGKPLVDVEPGHYEWAGPLAQRR
jgi:hypothetical protein